MHMSVVIERVLGLVGVSLLISSAMQYYVSNGNETQRIELVYDETFSRLRPDGTYKTELVKVKQGPQDGDGIELILGKKCLNGNPVFGGEVILWPCSWGSLYAAFNFTDNGQIVIDYGGTRGKKCLQDRKYGSTEIRVRLATCNSSNMLQIWSFAAVSGLYKRYGLLRNNGTLRCLARSPSFQSEANEFVISSQCQIDDERRRPDCEQAWYLPRYMQVYHDPNFVPKVSRAIKKAARKAKRSAVAVAGKIMCIILTHPEGHESKAMSILRTWGHKCDFLLFVSSEDDIRLPVLKVSLNGTESRDKIWYKARTAWMHAAQNYVDEAQWFLKADDDTYAHMGNLRKFLSAQNASKEKFYGRPFKLNGKTSRSYYSGGSGYVMSRGLLKMILGIVKPKSSELIYDGGWTDREKGPEDLLIADFLRKHGIRTVPSVDGQGRQLFLPMGPAFEWDMSRNRSLAAPNAHWFFKWSPESRAGSECCSEKWIASHYVRVDDMYRLDTIETSQCALHLQEWPHWGTRDDEFRRWQLRTEKAVQVQNYKPQISFDVESTTSDAPDLD